MRMTGDKRVLVVDDDVNVRDVVRRYLEQAGYHVTLAGDGENALRLATQSRPDLVVLDLMLPGIDGFEVCRRLHAAPGPEIPVVMLTARGEEEDRIAGLRLGADDYVAKPFSPRELVLRVASVLRRATAVPAVRAELVDGDLRIDGNARSVTRGGEPLSLTTREFDLLEFLITYAGTAFTRAELLSRVWGWEFGDQSTVTVHVRRLREKIEPDPANPRRIATVWGVGYRYDRAGCAPC
jgi:DNA-binding response OmpR family regulator